MKKLSIKNLILIFTLLILFICSFSKGVFAEEISWDDFIAGKYLCMEPGTTYRRALNIGGFGNILIAKANVIMKYDEWYPDWEWTGEYETNKDGTRGDKIYKKVWKKRRAQQKINNYMLIDDEGVKIANYFSSGSSGQIQVRIWARYSQ